MLAMDIEQLCGNLPKRLKRYDRAVDPADVEKTLEAIKAAGSPSTRFTASTTMDLPAPVSPVITFMPGSKSMVMSSISAR